MNLMVMTMALKNRSLINLKSNSKKKRTKILNMKLMDGGLE